jgi:hypothetical protein
MTRGRDYLPIGLHERPETLRDKAEDCIRRADALKAEGEPLEAMAFLALAEEYRQAAELRAVEAAADG